MYYLHPDCMEKCKADPSVLKRAKRQEEKCLPTLARNLAQRAHKRGAGHANPLPTLWVHSPFPMTNAQIAAERKQTLPQTVCRWIVALLRLLSALVSAQGDQRVTHAAALEDPKPGTKLHPRSFPSQTAVLAFTDSVLMHVTCSTHHTQPFDP